MTSRASNKADRIFVQNGRRLYRRRFNATETRIGLVILLMLAGTLLWVAWKGANPDPALFALEIDLFQTGAVEIVDRGPVPPDLATTGWSEGTLSRFDYDNLYVKINGREGYYKSFGFEALYFLSIVSNDDAQTVIDIELYDLGNSANAVGAYAGERSPEAKPTATEFGLMHVDRNALYLSRGRYYVRAIGSAESSEVRAQLEALAARFEELPSEPLPWGFALFVAQMGLDPGSISYQPENALSFGFASNVYSATREDDGELFVTPTASATEANALVGQFIGGFSQYGAREGDFIKDRYLNTYATVTAVGPWVVGIHRAPDTASAGRAVLELADIVRNMPAPAADRSEPAPEENVQEEYESDEY